MPVWGRRGGRLLFSVSVLALLSACAVRPQPLTQQDLARQAAADRQALFTANDPLTAPLTLPEAIARALKYNLDKRAKMMEEALALGQNDLDQFDLLPKVTAQAGYVGRSKPYVSRAVDYVTEAPSNANPTVSQDRDRFTADLGLSWNLLDFGVSYFTAHQSADRALIAMERRRKTVHNLVQEVRYAYWRAAAYQVLTPVVAKAKAEAETALQTARTVEQENLKAPVESLRYQRSVLEALRQLTAVQEELSTAQIELASLINAPPGREIRLASPDRMTPPEWALPLERMEEIAFVNNPDLHEQAYLARIAIDDTRKALLRLLPGVSLTASKQYDSNSFLIDKTWYETGAMLTWNLLNLVSAPAQIAYSESNEEAVQARRLALRLAVLAQVHVAERQFRNAISQYEQSDALWRVDRKLADLAGARTASDAQGILEHIAAQTTSIASELRRFQNFAQLELAYGKMQATLGEDLLPVSATATDIPSLSAAVAQRLDHWGEERPTAAEEPAPAPSWLQPVRDLGEASLVGLTRGLASLLAPSSGAAEASPETAPTATPTAAQP